MSDIIVVNSSVLASAAKDDFAGMRQKDNIMPRLVLQQFQSPGVVADIYKAGDYADISMKETIVPFGKTAKVVPLMFWLEWVEWNLDMNAPKDKKIIERSTDPQGNLSRRSDAYEKGTNSKGKEVFLITEAYNFVLCLPGIDNDINNLYITSFQKGSHKIGKSWLNRLRKQKYRSTEGAVPAPIWMNQWELSGERIVSEEGTYASPVIGASTACPVEWHAELLENATRLKAQRDALAKANSSTSDGDTASGDDITSGRTETSDL